MSDARIAVVLMNMGGPDTLKAVQPFLFNLFNDPCIIPAPKWIRWGIAQFISRTREKKARKIYASIGGGSPIYQQTLAQAQALEQELNQNSIHQTYKVFVTMRYWHPLSNAVIKQVKDFAPTQIIQLPLYPQYSSTTNLSSLNNWQQQMHQHGLTTPTQRVCCYPILPGFIAANVAMIKQALAKLSATEQKTVRLLFSAHSLPVKTVKRGDPYPSHVRQSMEAICQELNIPETQYRLCYQSKVGPLAWLGPSTEAEIALAVQAQVPIMLVPISFVSEHSETLYELDIQYKELAQDAPHYIRIPTVGSHPLFIHGLADMIQKSSTDDPWLTPFNCTQADCLCIRVKGK